MYSLLILFLIHFNAKEFFDKNFLRDKLYLSILYVTAFMLVMDILSRFDGNASAIYPVLNRIGNFVIFLLSPVIPSLWLIYVHFQVFNDEKRAKRLILPVFIVCTVDAASLIFSRFYGWFYYIGPDNVYHRGPLFLVPVFITFMLIFASYIILFKNRGNLGDESFYTLIFFTVPPFIGIVFQIKFYGMSLILNGVVLSMLVVFLNIQNHSMYTDHLTGVGNRKKLDIYLKEKVSLCTLEKGFSAILIDINNFKHINDTYGHNIGDNALETAVKLLKNCLRSGDFIARFGGDEFCIILNITDINELESLICRINDRLEEYNRSSSSLYKLGFSMGYAVYDYKSRKSAVEFMEQIDLLMYENKQAYKMKAEKSLQKLAVDDTENA